MKNLKKFFYGIIFIFQYNLSVFQYTWSIDALLLLYLQGLKIILQDLKIIVHYYFLFNIIIICIYGLGNFICPDFRQVITDLSTSFQNNQHFFFLGFVLKNEFKCSIIKYSYNMFVRRFSVLLYLLMDLSVSLLQNYGYIFPNYFKNSPNILQKYGFE